MNGVHLRKYGVQTTIDFELFEVDGVDFRVNAVHASGDSVIMKDEGVEANTTNSFTDEGTGYSIVLTATEMQAARIVLYFIDQTATKVWLDKSVVIETYGNASAMHAFDLDTASTAQTGDSFARLGAPAGASVSADLVVIDNFVDGLESTIGAAGAGLTSVPWNPAWDAEVESEANDALVALGLDHLVSTSVIGTDIANDSIIAQMVGDDAVADWDTYDNTTDSLEALRNRGDAAWTTGAGGSDRLLMVDTTIATLATQTSFTLTAGSVDDDAYNNCTIVVEDVSTSTQKAVGMVLDYTGSTKTVTLKEALSFTIATTDKVYILAENSLKSTVANRQLDVTATGAAGIDWANVENPTTALDLSGTDIQVCDTVTTNSDMRGTDSAALAADYTSARAGYLDNINGHTAQTGDSFARIGLAGAGLTNINLPDQTMNIVGNITGNLSGSVGSVTGAVGSVTGAVGSITGVTFPTNFADLAITITTGRVTVGTNVDKTGYSITGVITDLDSLNNVAATDIVSSGAITTSGGAVTTVTGVTNRVTANTDQIAGDATAATKLAAHALETIPVTFSAGGTTTTAVLNLVDGAAASSTNDVYNGRLLVFNNSTLNHQIAEITDYVGATKTATISAVTTGPGAAHTARMV